MREDRGGNRAAAFFALTLAIASVGCSRKDNASSPDSGADAQTDVTLPIETRADTVGVTDDASDTRLAQDFVDGVSGDGVDVRPAPDVVDVASGDGLDVRLTLDVVDGVDLRPEMGSEATVPVDGQRDTGTSAPCTDDSPVPRSDDNYICGTCSGDIIYPVVCSEGQLRCATSWTGSNGTVISVPPGQYLISRSDWNDMTGLCAYLVPATYPGFVLVEPGAATTDFAAGNPILLKALSSYSMVKPTFDWLKADRTSGEQLIRNLVTLTDMAKNVPVPYTIGDPTVDATWQGETVALRPATALATQAWYRVTVLPGDSQPQAKIHTFNRGGTAWLTSPQTTDFYTYSRPMVSSLDVAAKSGGTSKLMFVFSEMLLGTDLSSDTMAQVAIDGTILSTCITPYPCSGSAPKEFSTFELVGQMPSSFREITLRVPHVIRGVAGGTILDGTAGNPNAKVDGTWAVYTFKAADMTLLPSGLEQVWYHGGI